MKDEKRQKLLEDRDQWELALSLDGEIILRGKEDHNSYCAFETLVDELRREQKIEELAALVQDLLKFKEKIDGHLEYMLSA